MHDLVKQMRAGQQAAMPPDGLVLQYRIERLDDEGQWRAEKATRTYRRGDDIRVRFTANVSGALHVLNSSDRMESLHKERFLFAFVPDRRARFAT